MKKTRLLSIAGAITLAFAQQVAAKPYHVAVLPSWHNCHTHECDYAFKENGMTWTNLQAKAEQMDWMADHLDDFDLLFGPPLFGWMGKQKNEPLGYDMTKYAKKIRKWIEKGGCFFIIDANYPEALTWIKSLDPSLEVSAGDCQGNGPAVGVEPQDSILFFPKRAEYGFTWGHMTVPDQKKTGWKILSRCGHGDPTLMIKRMGRGIILISSLRSYVPEFVENLRVNQQFLVLGLEVQDCFVPDPIPGTNTFSVTCRNLSNRKMKGELSLTLTPLVKDEEGKPVPAGEPKVYRQRSVIDPGTNGVYRLDCRISERGLYRAELTLEAGGTSGTCFSRDMDLPPLFAVSGPRYRGLVAEDRRFDAIKLGTRIFPNGEDLSELSVRIRIEDKEKHVLGKGEVAAQAGAAWVDVPFSRKTRPGTYDVIGELVDKSGKILAVDQDAVQVVDSTPGLTVYDEDRMMMHDGRPFFPLGIYHPNGRKNYTSDFPVLADLGFNTIQTFSWAGTKHIDLIHKVGCKVLWELLPHRIPGLAAAQAANMETHPAPLLYYTMDEPPAAAFDLVHELDKAFRENDPGRPTYLVSYKPYEFHRNAWLSDVLAPDPYPWSTKQKDDSNIAMVSRWLDRAHEASGSTRPVICVPQAFGAEPPDIWRNMAIQAIAHGASGLIWYAWNESNGVGLAYNEKLQETVREFLAQIKSISPAILNDKDLPHRFTAADYKIHAMTCRDPKTKTRYLLVANSSKEPVTANVELQWIPAGLTELVDAFGDRTISVSNGVAEFRLGRFESGIYCWDGPKPVLERPATDFAVRKLPARASGKKLTVVAPGATVPANAYTNLQMAVDAAKDGDVILVGEGTYGPIVSDNVLVDIIATGARTNTFIDARNKGRCAALTQKPFGDMSFQTNTLLRGFTLRNGDSRVDAFRDTLGGAVIGGTLEDCVIERSKAVYGGGAAYSILSNCTFRANTATKNGGAAMQSTLFDSLVTGNSADYDGGALEFSTAIRCTLRDNRARRDGGASHYGRNVSCHIRNNSANRHGGATAYSDNAHSLIRSNRTWGGNGGGVFNGETSFCTIVGNTAANFGGGIAGLDLDGGGASRFVHESIIRGNYSNKDKGATRSYYNMYPGRGCWMTSAVSNKPPRNIQTNNPCFMVESWGDYRLRPDSPCRDLGGLFLDRSTVDPDGNPRPRGGGPDAGCFEVVPDDLPMVEWDFSDNALWTETGSHAITVITPKAKPRLENGALVMKGDISIATRYNLANMGATLSCWSTLLVESEFKPDAKGGPVFALTHSKDQGVWAEIDPRTGIVRVVVGIGNPKDENRFVFESKKKVTDGQWHKIALQIDRHGGPEAFLKAKIDGVDLTCVRQGKLSPWTKLYNLPGTGVQLGCRDKDQFHGAFKSLKVSVHADPVW